MRLSSLLLAVLSVGSINSGSAFVSHHPSGSSPSSAQRQATERALSSSSKLNTPQQSSENDVETTTSSTASMASAAASSGRPDMKAYSSAYATVFEELPCKECQPSMGKIPEDLVGTYFRCGPAMFTAGSIVPPKTSVVQPKTPPVPDGQDMERMVSHPFEGDGAILGVTFGGGTTQSATARFRFVRTAGFTNERKKGKKLYSSMDSTRELGPRAAAGLGNDLALPLYRHHLQPGLNKFRKNTSNTRAFYWGKRLITLWEGGLPYKLDGLALSTEGRSQLGGVLQETDPFGCKGVIDSKTSRALFYSNNQNPKSSDLTVYEFNSNFRLVPEQGGKITTQLPGFAMISDFCATENYAVFVQPNVVANGMQYMFNKEPGKVITLDEKTPSTLHLIARVGSKKQSKSFSIPFDGVADAELQFCNGYEENGGNLVIFDAIRSDGSNLPSTASAPKWPWAKSLAEYASVTPKKSLWRYTVDIKSGSVKKELLSNLQCSFGVVNPAVSAQKHRYIYSAVGSMGTEVAPPQGVAKYDYQQQETTVWMPQEYEFCGEPMFASKKSASAEEDDGYILSVLYNGQTSSSEMIILNAQDIAAGPVARIPLGMRIPHGLFGCFTNSEEANWDLDTIDRRAKLADKMESKGNMWNEVKSDFSGLGLRLDDIEEIFPDLM